MENVSGTVTQIQTKAIEDFEKGNKKNAIKSLMLAVQEHPTESLIYNNLACMLWDVGLTWDALYIIKKAVTINPSDKQAASNLEAISDFLKKERLQRPGYGFEGWRMKNNHAMPWRGRKDNETFLQAHVDSLTQLEHTEKVNMDEHMWRHWIVSFAVRYAVEFTEQRDVEAVECGVYDGLTAFFALREFQGQVQKGHLDRFKMHLFDSWEPMESDYLLDSEKKSSGKFPGIDIERTKRNLSGSSEHIFYHKGFIPASLNSEPVCTRPIIYLHIDVNSAMPTVAVLEHFWDRIPPKGVIAFDDFGWPGYEETKDAVEEFFESKSGILLPFPTGQAFFIKNG